MSDPRRFDFRELAGADDAGGDAELGQALAAARALEATLSGPEARPSADLADRIMAAVAREPAPRPLGIVAAIRRRPGVMGLVDSLALAWDRALKRSSPVGLRAGAFAYVAMVAVLAVSLAGAAAFTAAGALGLLGPSLTQAPVTLPTLPTPAELVSPAPTEAESAEPSDSPGPTQSAQPSIDPSGGSQEPGDSHLGGSASVGPVPSDDRGGEASGSPSATQTPKASDSPRPTSSD